MDISLDIETLGLSPDAMIVSIAAVPFDKVVYEQDSFIRHIDLEYGVGSINPSTVQWWMSHPEALKSTFMTTPRISIKQALLDFSEWLGKFNNPELWQRGNKDQQWLDFAYTTVGLSCPYTYSQWNDQRTVTKLFKHLLNEKPSHIVEHDSLHDAKWQASVLCSIFSKLKV